ncbi:MAG: HEAT repeat domain-containing protein [Fibrobacterota bacterium]
MMYRFIPFLMVCLLIAGGWVPARAQSDLEDMFLRKAVKEFVAKQYDEAIADLEQVLAANKSNPKAKKLISKCLERKGSLMLAQNQIPEAARYLRQALEEDPQNSEALKGMEQLKFLSAAAQAKESQNAPAPNSAYQGQSAVPAAPAVAPPPQQIVISGQMGAPDSHQTKVISSLLQNFNKQQEMMSQQMNASNKMMLKTDDEKDKYLQALVKNADQKNDMMKSFIYIGGAVVLGVILIIGLLFVFVFHKFSKASELRTLQATDTIAALLTGPGGSSGRPQLLLGSSKPAGAASDDPGLQTASLDALSNIDPVQRAHAVEAVAAEIIEPEKGTRAEKIKRLEELLKDDNNRVRANAAKALYEIDKEISLKTLKEMLENDSKRMRASSVWALGEIGSEEALTVILGTAHEDDEIVKYNIKVALEKIKSLNRFPMSKDQQDRINGMLVQYVDLM